MFRKCTSIVGVEKPRERSRVDGGRLVRVFDVLVGCILALFVSERPAHAYIDPGAGTMLWQVLVGLFAGTVYYVSRLFSGIRGKRGDRDEK